MPRGIPITTDIKTAKIVNWICCIKRSYICTLLSDTKFIKLNIPLTIVLPPCQ